MNTNDNEKLIQIADAVQAIQPHRIRGFDGFNALRIKLICIEARPDCICLARAKFHSRFGAILDITQQIDGVEVTFRALAQGSCSGTIGADNSVMIFSTQIDGDDFILQGA